MILRQSSINTYLNCPAQYKYRYIDGLVIPPGSAAKQGTAFHTGLDVNYKQKINTKKDLPLDEVLDATSTAFDQVFSEEVYWNNEEKGEGLDKVKGNLKDETIGILKKYHTEVAPTIQPVESEKQFEIQFSNVDYSVTGTVDLIDDEGVVHDHKTTGQKPSALKASHIIQGGIYCLGVNLEKAQFDFAVKKGKKKPEEMVSISMNFDESMRTYTLNILSQVQNAIKKEVFFPNRTQNLCSRKWCGYWALCQSDFGGTVKDNI